MTSNHFIRNILLDYICTPQKSDNSLMEKSKYHSFFFLLFFPWNFYENNNNQTNVYFLVHWKRMQWWFFIVGLLFFLSLSNRSKSTPLMYIELGAGQRSQEKKNNNYMKSKSSIWYNSHCTWMILYQYNCVFGWMWVFPIMVLQCTN